MDVGVQRSGEAYLGSERGTDRSTMALPLATDSGPLCSQTFCLTVNVLKIDSLTKADMLLLVTSACQSVHGHTALLTLTQS